MLGLSDFEKRVRDKFVVLDGMSHGQVFEKVFECILSNFGNHMILIYFILIFAINLKAITCLNRE